MPPLTRWFIKSSLLFLVLAGLAAFLQAANSLFSLAPLFSVIGPVYFHIFLVGWITQLIFGVVFWMFPKASMQKPRGSESLGWASFALLNMGLVLRIFSEPINSLSPSVGWGWLLVLSAVLQWLAGLTFVANTWQRVKEK